MSDYEWGDLVDARDRFTEDVSRDLDEIVAKYAPPVEVVTFSEFVSREEASVEPLLGSADETILPADGMLLMYGDGGAGKTTLTIDAVAHLSSGNPWLGIDVGRPVRTLLIENEGPRGKFRQMLSDKFSSWNGHAPFSGNVHVLEEPWTRFTLQDDAHRESLAEECIRREIDLLVMGPLATLGMVGGGTPDEISTFERLLRALRELLTRPLAFWIVHHENKSGDVSGAWERVPDTLVHVTATGHGHTKLSWRKTRWSSEKHGTSVDLLWADGRSFELVEKPERDPWEEMLKAFIHANTWRTAKEAGKLIHLTEAQAKKVLEELVRRGDLVFEKGPPGRHANALCYALPSARSNPAHTRADTPDTLVERSSARLRSPVRGAAAQRADADEGEVRAESVRADVADDDGIPF